MRKFLNLQNCWLPEAENSMYSHSYKSYSHFKLSNRDRYRLLTWLGRSSLVLTHFLVCEYCWNERGSVRHPLSENDDFSSSGNRYSVYTLLVHHFIISNTLQNRSDTNVTCIRMIKFLSYLPACTVRLGGPVLSNAQSIAVTVNKDLWLRFRIKVWFLYN